MRKVQKHLILLVSIITIIGCSDMVGSIGLKTDDATYIENLHVLLTKRNIPHQVEGNYISWDREYSEKIEEVQKKLSSYSGALYKDKRVRNYFKSLLADNGKEYFESKKEDGVWVHWWPTDRPEEDRHSLEVAKYKFSLMQKESVSEVNK